MSNDAAVKLSLRSLLRENVALLLTYSLGAILVASVSWPWALLYLLYCLLSNVAHMAWVCPYCAHYAAATCPAGYHLLSGGRFRPNPARSFRRQFRSVVVLLAPGWFLPPIVALVRLLSAFSWPVAGLTLLFCLAGFVWLPADSRRHCAACDNQDCPRRRTRPIAAPRSGP